MNRKQRDIKIVKVLDWLDRYGSLMEYLDNKTTGYGTMVIALHGKRAVKAGQLGQMEVLPPIDFRVDAKEQGDGSMD
jgi:hypothetical protein